MIPLNEGNSSHTKVEDGDRLGPMTTKVNFSNHVNDSQSSLKPCFQPVVCSVENDNK